MTTSRQTTGPQAPSAGRLLIAGIPDSRHPRCYFILGGLLAGLCGDDRLNRLQAVIVNNEPEVISRVHHVAAVTGSFPSLVETMAQCRTSILIGKTFNDSPLPEDAVLDEDGKYLLAGMIVGIRTAVLGAGARRFDPSLRGKAIAEILNRVDVVTVRDQASALTLMQAGLSVSPIVTADMAFLLKPRLENRPRSGKLGIVFPPTGLPLDASRSAFVAEVIDRLKTRFALAPVVITWDHLQAGAENQPASLGLANAERIDCTSAPSVEALLDSLSSLDLLISSEYSLIVGAALCGVPTIAIGDDPAVSALAQQLRLGNYAIASQQLDAPNLLAAAQQILVNPRRVREALAQAVRAKAGRAAENLNLLAPLADAMPAPLRSVDAFEKIPELQPTVRELRDVIGQVLRPTYSVGADKSGLDTEHRVTRIPLSAEPLVTIYICAYNAGKWIEQAVSSALAQTYRHLEVLVVDDGSTDDTVQRVRKFADARIVLHQIPHGGLAKVRTYAKEHFHGELVVNLDADDWIAPALIAEQVALLQANPEVDVTYCDYVLVDAAGKPTGVVWNYADFPDPVQLAAEMFQAGCSRVPNGSMMERAQVARRVGAYDPTLKTAVDFEYLANLAGVASAFRGVHEPLYFYRDFGGGHSGNYSARNFTVTTVLRRLWERYGGELLLGESIGRGLSGNCREAVYLCRAGDIISRHGETYMSRGAPERFFELAAEFYRDAFARDQSNMAAYTRMMQLAALGFGQDRTPHNQGKKRPGARADVLYANQPELDVLFEEVLPALLVEGQPPIRITVLDHNPPCAAHTIALEAVRRGLSIDELRVQAIVPAVENEVFGEVPVFPQTVVFNDGLNHLSPQTAERMLIKQPDGTYRPPEAVTRLVSINRHDPAKSIGAEITGESEVVVAQSTWNTLDAEAARHVMSKLVETVRQNGFLFLGGHNAARNAALAEYPNLEPVMTRFDDVHDGWRYRRSVYGSRADGLGPLDRRWPDWPRRYGAIFRKRQAQHLAATNESDLKSYWMERGKIYRQQYPARPIETQPVPHRLVQALQAEQPTSVLDYGCGFGKILREVRRVLPMARLVGLDISGSVLADGHQYLLGGPPVGLVESDGKTIPLLSNSVDVTFTHVTLIHVPHQEIRDVLAELVRVTRNTLYIGETADSVHESFYYFAHDYPALFAELGLAAEELNVPNCENQPGARLFRIDVSGQRQPPVTASAGAAAESICRPGTDRHLRLLVVSDRRTVHTQRFCRYFRERGHEVHLYDATPNWEGFEGIVQHWVDPVQYPERDMQVQFYSRVARLRDVVRTFEPDWVHGHFLIGWGWWAALASAGIPLALTAWGSDVFLLPREAPQVQSLTRWSIRLADLLTADSRALAEATANLADGRKQVLLVPFGIDTNAFHPGVDDRMLRQRLMIPEHTRVVLSPRQIKPGANIETILEAFARVRRHLSDTVLVLKTYLTTFDQQSEYMALIRKKISDLDLWSNVRIIHDLPHHEMPALYALADVTVSIRDTDGTPCTLFESSAAGTPVVAGNVSSLAEWIRDGENGFLVPVKDAAATAEAICRVLARGPEIDRVAANAREFAVAQGDYRRCFAGIEEAYLNPGVTASPSHATLNDLLGRRASRLDILNAARTDLCRAIDRADHDHGLRVFNTLPRLLPEKSFEELGSLVPDRIPQPV